MSDDSLDDPFGSVSMPRRDDDLPETLAVASSLLPASLIQEISPKEPEVIRSKPDTSHMFSSPARKHSKYEISHLSSSSLSPTHAQLAKKELGFEELFDQSGPNVTDIDDVVNLCSGQFATQGVNQRILTDISGVAPVNNSRVQSMETQDTVILTATGSRPDSRASKTILNTSNMFSSPARKRSKYVISHLSSSSLKKRTQKPLHCKFCARHRSRTSLEQHLKESEECYNLYCRLLKVRSMNAILLKLFNCLGCDQTGKFKLATHLSKSPRCYKIYETRFESSNIKDLSKKLKNFTRQSNSSRQSLTRKFENAKAKETRAESKTVSQAINEFKASTALSNYRRCYKCSGNFLDSGTKEVNPSSDEFEEDNLLLKPELMRMNKFYICHSCSNGRTCEQVGTQENILTSEVKDGTKILKPSNPDSNNNPFAFQNFEVEGKEKILLPTNIGSLNLFKNKKLTQPNNVTRIIYNCEEPTPADISSLYIDRLLKFRNRKDHYDRVAGTIGDNRDKILSRIVPIIDTSDIHSSDHWEEQKRTATKFRFRQLGPASVGFQITTDPSDIETIATSLIIEGHVITVTFDGDENFDLQTKYFLHPHSTSEECPGENCQKLDLEEVIEKIVEEHQIPTFNHKFSSSYICSGYQKTHSLVESLIKTRSFALHSEDYFVGIKFNSQGSIIIEGSLWPAECAMFNEALSNCSLSGEDPSSQKKSYLEFIDRSIYTTVSPEILKHKLNLTNDKAYELSGLVARNQMYLDSDPKMMGIESAFLERPEAESNIGASKECVQIFRGLLLTLTDDDKFDLSLSQWLGGLEDKFQVKINEESVILWHDDQRIMFRKDDRLVKLIHRLGELKGIYQYSVSCSDICGVIVLRAEQISNFFTNPYNPTFMKSFKCKMKVLPINGFQDWTVKTDLNQEVDETLMGEEDSHRISSLIELFALADARKIQDINSSPTEFVDTMVAKDQKFRKVKEETDDSYKFEGSDKFFELLSSNVSRHKQRKNGEHLLLAETCMHYDYVGRAKSEEMYDIFDKRLDKVPLSEVESIYEDTEGKKLMPEFIICSNRQVMKIRKREKILQYRELLEGSTDYKRNKVMLFFPLKPGYELSGEVISKKIEFQLK